MPVPDDVGLAVRVRRTVVDGEVRLFATSFREVVQERRGTRYDAGGPFLVSACRSRVTVHFCTVVNRAQFDIFLAALTLAVGTMEELRCETGTR